MPCYFAWNYLLILIRLLKLTVVLYIVKTKDLLINSQTTSESVLSLSSDNYLVKRDQSPPSLFLHASPIEDDLKVYFITNWMIVNQVGQIVCGPLVLHGPIMRWQSKHCCCWCCPLVIEEMIKQTVNLFSKSLIEGSSLPIPHEWRSFREHRSPHIFHP